MKKTICLLLNISVSIFCFAQDKTSCPGISMIKDEMDQSINYASESSYNGIYVMKIINPKVKFTTLVLNIVTPDLDLNNTGLYIKFEDGVIVRKENSKNKCTYFRDGMYQLTGTYDLTDLDMEQFKNKKIIKFQLDKNSFTLSDNVAVKLKDDINCIQSLN